MIRSLILSTKYWSLEEQKINKNMVYDNFVKKITQQHITSRYRKYEKHKGVMKHILTHNMFHRMLLPGIHLLRKIRKLELNVVADRRDKKETPVIYACTHIGGFDIETLFEAIADPCYLFLADPREIYINFDGFLLWLNGVICFESDNKMDRNIAKEKAIELLKSGGGLMIFPEGAWNIYESLPVMPLFWGTADIAIKSESTIVPVAIERYGKKYFVNIGRKVDNHLRTKMDKSILTQILRDEMATLKWEIWEKQGKHKRSDLDDCSETFLNQIFGEKNTSVTLEDVLKCRYYPK